MTDKIILEFNNFPALANSILAIDYTRIRLTIEWMMGS
jgi:hypothetical protein